MNEVGTGIYDRDRIETTGQSRRRTTEGNKAKKRTMQDHKIIGQMEIEEHNFMMIIEINLKIDLNKN